MSSKYNVSIEGGTGPIIMGDGTLVEIDNTRTRDATKAKNVNIHRGPTEDSHFESFLNEKFKESRFENNDINYHIKQGYALIIHNDSFPNRAEPDRSGSDKDMVEITKFCNNAGLHINDTTSSTENLTATEIENLCEEIGQRDFSRYDSFVCFILSHGNESGIYGVDDNIVPMQTIISRFKDNTGLAGKPKLFFIQACRGPSQDDGVEADSVPVHNTARLHLPKESDTLVVYSSVEGYESYRSPTHGSWFIITLMEKFNEYWHKMHLLDILTLVNNKIAGYETDGGKKQMSCQMSTLTKFLYFNLNPK